MSSRNKSHVLGFVLIAACAFGVWKFSGWLLSGSDDNNAQAMHVDQLVNQVWIDHIPENSRDMIAHLVLIDDSRTQVGVTGLSSTWRHWIELFWWRLDDSTLSVFFPQERARGQVEVSTWECEGQAPEPFQLCLRVSNEHGESTMLYSRHDWVVEADSLDADLNELLDAEPTLAGIANGLRGVRAANVDDDDLEERASTWERRTMSLGPLGLR